MTKRRYTSTSATQRVLVAYLAASVAALILHTGSALGAAWFALGLLAIIAASPARAWFLHRLALAQFDVEWRNAESLARRAYAYSSAS